MSLDNHARVLVVDDDHDYRETLCDILTSRGYDVENACNGEEALDILTRHAETIDLVLLDRMMPQMDGLDVLRSVRKRASLSHMPVVMQTGQCSLEDIRDGIDAGAYYYLTKPYDHELLLSIVQSAANDSARRRDDIARLENHSRGYTLMHSGVFRFRTFDDAGELARFFASLCPDPALAALGLSEILENAVEHGNLEIDYETKRHCTKQNTRLQEIQRRQRLPDYAQREVTVEFQRSSDALVFTVCDQGHGFDWRPYLTIDPHRVTDPNGRGIALANMLTFDHMEYRGKGNEVVCTVKLS